MHEERFPTTTATKHLICSFEKSVFLEDLLFHETSVQYVFGRYEIPIHNHNMATTHASLGPGFAQWQ